MYSGGVAGAELEPIRGSSNDLRTSAGAFLGHQNNKGGFKHLYQSPKTIGFGGDVNPFKSLQGSTTNLTKDQNNLHQRGQSHNPSSPINDAGLMKSHDLGGNSHQQQTGLPPKAASKLGQAKRKGRNHIPPNNTFGVSREEREKVMSYKYFSPPTGAYYVKYKQIDANDKITYVVPQKSSPERDPRFDYTKNNTLLWLPQARDIENNRIAEFNLNQKCHKCVRKEQFGSGSTIGESCNHSISG